MQPYPELISAASGDLAALRALRDECRATAESERDWSAMVEALLLGRLAYAASADVADGSALAGLLDLALEGLSGDGEDAKARAVLAAERAALSTNVGSAC